MDTRFYEIDILRFLSALAVVIFHYTYTGYMEGFATIANFPQLREFTKYGYVGINFFFIISGFVIFMSIADNNANRFLASRFSRLFPAYWFALWLTTFVTILIGGDTFSVTIMQFFANVTMINPLFGHSAIDSAYWTLFIELQFYLVVLLILQLKLSRYFLHLIALTLIGSTVALFTDWAAAVDMWHGIFPHWSGYFALGCLFYLTKRDGLTPITAALLVLGYLFVVKQSILFGELMSQWFAIDFDSGVLAVLNSLFFFSFCITSLCKSHPLRTKMAYFLGILTYPLYLIHQHIGYMVFNTFGNENNIGYLVLLTTAVMLVLAYLIHRGIEKTLAPVFKQSALKLLDQLTAVRQRVQAIRAK
ncbi:acyltransferase family protein [Shewanella waksmanii]|uniref:acyltransferase family protein n=1 Tax=Shewanella waksmanii TaxID=213783 RepID=UPI00048A9683|nr:acyltransferase [Shewanella waksmanii]